MTGRGSYGCVEGKGREYGGGGGGGDGDGDGC